MNKIHLSYKNIHQLVKKISDNIKSSQIELDAIIAIGGGGYIPGRIFRTYFRIPVFCVSVELYDDKTNKPGDKPVKKQWLDKNAISQIRGKKVLIVDEVDDTRTTLSYVSNEIGLYTSSQNISIAVLYNKIKQKNGILNFQINYFSGKEVNDEWLIFPWEVENI